MVYYKNLCIIPRHTCCEICNEVISVNLEVNKIVLVVVYYEYSCLTMTYPHVTKNGNAVISMKLLLNNVVVIMVYYEYLCINCHGLPYHDSLYFTK